MSSGSDSDSDETNVTLLENTPSVPVVESQCSICLADHPSDEYPIEPITSACTHPTSVVCRECMRTYIALELSYRGTAAMICPVCREAMSYFDVMRNAAPEDFDRYDERVTIESLQDEPGFRWCPQPGCPGGQIQAHGDAEPIVTCNHCRQRFCFTHRIPWHTGLTCRQYDETPELMTQVQEAEWEEEDFGGAVVVVDKSAAREEDDEELESAAKDRERRNSEVRRGEAYVQNIAKHCPHCFAPTEREGGCKHMTCFICSFEWCWECEKGWVSGHLNTACAK